MPRPHSSRIPSYRRHKSTGRAVVTLDGKDFYLGLWNSKASEVEYDRLIAEWIANGRRLRTAETETTVSEVLNAYRKFAEGYYRRDGKHTSEYSLIVDALKVVRELYGRKNADEFGPLALKVVRQRMIDSGRGRSSINKMVGRIRRCFRWATENELVRAEVYHGLMAVSGLKQGRSEARETAPIQPIADADVQAILPHLSQTVCDMVRLQRLTGSRPQDVYNLRPCDVDTSAEVWLYRPEHHKTEHHGRERVIAIGPKGQEILRPYLLRAKEDYCFSPAEAEKQRREAAGLKRKTPQHQGNRPGSNKKRRPKTTPGEQYDANSYRRAIHRACDKAGVDRWSPNRLRHSAGTEIRKQFGLEAAQVILGHAKADVTQIYAERDHQKAIEIMREIG